MAEKLGVPFNWELRTVYGIGHSGSKMSEPGANYLLAGKTEEPLFPLKPRAKTPPADETPRQREQRQRNQELLRGSGTDGEASPF